MRASEPVPEITFLALSCELLPSAVTSTVSTPFCAGPVSLPYPRMVSTLFFFIRKSRPLVCLVTIFDLRSWIGGPIQLARVYAFDAEFLCFFEVVPEFGVEEQRLGRDAAHVQAGAAEHVVFFDEGGFQAVLAGADGGSVSSRTAADDCDVIYGFGQVISSL